MKLTRRNLFKTAGAAGAATAVSGAAVVGSGLAAEAVAGATHTTLDRTFLVSKPDAKGWARIVRGPGEPHVVRAGLGATAQAGRAGRRTPVLAFAQLSDVHIIDAQSPARIESGEEVSSSAYRPQEMLTAHVAESMVRRLNKIGSGPVSGLPLAFSIQTGDNSDNSQYNEIRWNIDVLDGEEVRPDSGDLTQFEGVMDGNAEFYDPLFWHPGGSPAGKPKDQARKNHGFPVLPGLLDACRRPFQATGLDTPWYAVFGNHDQLVQGNFPHGGFAGRETGTAKQTAMGTRTVTADPDRRFVSRQEWVEEHFVTTGLPVGHGFTDDNRTQGHGYYTFDQGDVRFLVMDTVNENGGSDGSMAQSQFEWVKQVLAASGDKYVVAASHHTSWSMDNARVNPGAEPRVLGGALVQEFLAHDNLIAWVNGHTHDNVIMAHTSPTGGFWEINTASHIDWPQQARLVELLDNADGTLSIFCTMVDHQAKRRARSYDTVMQLATLSRLVSANDWQAKLQSRGKKNARNVELLLPKPALA